MEDLYASNLISANRCRLLLGKAHDAGAKVKKHLWKGSSKNAARGLTRKKLKRTLWPDKYWFECRVWDRKAGELRKQWVCIWLIHELLELMWRLGDKDVILSTECMDTQGKEVSIIHDMYIYIGSFVRYRPFRYTPRRRTSSKAVDGVLVCWRAGALASWRAGFS